jgi:hypothetical protein
MRHFCMIWGLIHSIFRHWPIPTSRLLGCESHLVRAGQYCGMFPGFRQLAMARLRMSAVAVLALAGLH